MLTKIKKRDGTVVDFDDERIVNAIFAAARAVGGRDIERARQLTKIVVAELEKNFDDDNIPNVEDVQDVVEKVLIEQGHAKTAKAYILYRHNHADLRELSSMLGNFDLMEAYLNQNDWRVKENANMTYSLQGLNFHISSELVAKYWLNKLYPSKIGNAHKLGDFHIHDLGSLAAYCVGWDLQDLLSVGFKGVPGKVASKPAKHFRTALGQIVNFFYTLQGEAAGAQAFSNFDTYLAPFIAYDKMDYKEVKQAMQEFIYNVNVPTRVGFQCVSEDTEILTPEGWKSYDEVNEGSSIKTFNLKTGKIEDQKVTYVFKRRYKGKMYNLKNRIQDQLISPKHRVVRKLFNSDSFVLEPIEEVAKLKSPFIIPIAGENSNKKAGISDEQIKLMAWIIAEGSVEKPVNHRSCYRISIYQSKEKNSKHYNEIKKLLNHFKLTYSEFESTGLGKPVRRMRLNAESSKKVHKWFGTRETIKFIPSILLGLNQEQSKLFLETYLKADGFEESKIATTSREILDALQIIAVNAGYGFTTLVRKPTIGTKDIFVLRLIKHSETYIQKIKKVDYDGVIWCPHTKNETIIARRKGKVFITGNTPFTNITMDLKVPKFMQNLPAIIGGNITNDTYGSFQDEMDMINRAFAEVMLEGDASGRPFTFPIPTYNITKDFDWDNENQDAIWEMTGKYGIPYFANFINSDMSPDDVRSMCCRLRLDTRELRKRGGGLFGANPLTGSIGVVTINLPKIGYLSKSEEKFFEKLSYLMDLAKESLELKRKFIEHYTEKGLYPYSRFYLRGIKDMYNEYWKNHFSTIGLIGMNEALLNFMGVDLTNPEGHAFAIKIMDFMRDRLAEYQEETGHVFNLEASPAEGATYRLARIDKKNYPKIIVANEQAYRAHDAKPYYTNSSLPPVGWSGDLFEILDNQDPLQSRYTGGTVFHAFLGERIDKDAAKTVVKKVFEKYTLPYLSITPTFSICPIHGYIAGEHEYCPICDEELRQKMKTKQVNANQQSQANLIK